MNNQSMQNGSNGVSEVVVDGTDDSLKMKNQVNSSRNKSKRKFRRRKNNNSSGNNESYHLDGSDKTLVNDYSNTNVSKLVGKDIDILVPKTLTGSNLDFDKTTISVMKNTFRIRDARLFDSNITSGFYKEFIDRWLAERGIFKGDRQTEVYEKKIFSIRNASFEAFAILLAWSRKYSCANKKDLAGGTTIGEVFSRDLVHRFRNRPTTVTVGVDVENSDFAEMSYKDFKISNAVWKQSYQALFSAFYLTPSAISYCRQLFQDYLQLPGFSKISIFMDNTIEYAQGDYLGRLQRLYTDTTTIIAEDSDIRGIMMSLGYVNLLEEAMTVNNDLSRTDLRINEFNDINCSMYNYPGVWLTSMDDAITYKEDLNKENPFNRGGYNPDNSAGYEPDAHANGVAVKSTNLEPDPSDESEESIVDTLFDQIDLIRNYIGERWSNVDEIVEWWNQDEVRVGGLGDDGDKKVVCHPSDTQYRWGAWSSIKYSISKGEPYPIANTWGQTYAANRANAMFEYFLKNLDDFEDGFSVLLNAEDKLNTLFDDIEEMEFDIDRKKGKIKNLDTDEYERDKWHPNPPFSVYDPCDKPGGDYPFEIRFPEGWDLFKNLVQTMSELLNKVEDNKFNCDYIKYLREFEPEVDLSKYDSSHLEVGIPGAGLIMGGVRQLARFNKLIEKSPIPEVLQATPAGPAVNFVTAISEGAAKFVGTKEEAKTQKLEDYQKSNAQLRGGMDIKPNEKKEDYAKRVSEDFKYQPENIKVGRSDIYSLKHLRPYNTFGIDQFLSEFDTKITLNEFAIMDRFRMLRPTCSCYYNLNRTKSIYKLVPRQNMITGRSSSQAIKGEFDFTPTVRAFHGFTNLLSASDALTWPNMFFATWSLNIPVSFGRAYWNCIPVGANPSIDMVEDMNSIIIGQYAYYRELAKNEIFHPMLGDTLLEKLNDTAIAVKNLNIRGI